MPEASDFSREIEGIALSREISGRSMQAPKPNNIYGALQFSQSRPKGKPRRAVYVPPVNPSEILDGGDARVNIPRVKTVLAGGASSNIGNILNGGTSTRTITRAANFQAASSMVDDFPVTNIADGAFLNSVNRSSVFISNTVR